MIHLFDSNLAATCQSGTQQTSYLVSHLLGTVTTVHRDWTVTAGRAVSELPMAVTALPAAANSHYTSHSPVTV